MKRGEIWRVRIPTTPGHAQSGERPALIVQDDAATASLPTVLIIPFTSTLAASRFAGTVIVHPDANNGLSAPSVALVFQILALDKRFFVHRMGEVGLPALDSMLALAGQPNGKVALCLRVRHRAALDPCVQHARELHVNSGIRCCLRSQMLSQATSQMRNFSFEIKFGRLPFNQLSASPRQVNVKRNDALLRGKSYAGN